MIRFYAPFCKACRAFGIKFRKLATERGERTNAAGGVVRRGDARFGEIEYSSNVRLCKNLSIKTFPAVIIFRGGVRAERLSEIVCKQTAIDDIISEMDQLMASISGK
jgi:thiol-disulfide isomerase/thioredoxin